MAPGRGGVMHRADLRELGITRQDVRTEVEAGRWTPLGRHTVQVHNGELTTQARLWHAVWESGSGARLDGAAALLGHGMTGFTPEVIDVCLPVGSAVRPVEGVRARRCPRLPPSFPVGVPRVRPEWATLRAAQWARTDRTAALLMCLPIQQRLIDPRRLLAAWETVERSPRRALLNGIVADAVDGAQSLGELDFAAMCRARGLPEPRRQTIHQLPSGRAYLDAEWEVGLVVEIDGGHHGLSLNVLDDAWRANEVSIKGRLVLRLPILGLRLDQARFLDQVARAHAILTRRGLVA
ncbi:MAG TPA: hypothetical protein DEH05_04905 [Propionibacteriaceae bacterium]|uniref:DUF559 domain-containing protein n=1 Tax=Candidatus Phosphoribacter hodrii TaxID=2953743 RepID=A0A934X2Q1_9MICO|nr:hypothetical protein [Candidatus Phosphoribacter hodrii]HBX80454.1 hypothetical protein [Propionibacteriaceae bacterium]